MTFSNTVTDMARDALLSEINLHPKPGLVDPQDCGAHSDMDYSLFLESIHAITPFFRLFYEEGYKTAYVPASQTLRVLRKIGIRCEQTMFTATKGVNTHKGGVFSLGLLCGAVGRLTATKKKYTSLDICAEVSSICDGLVQNDLEQVNSKSQYTAGESIYLRHGLGGARAEAESGFATVQRYALPAYRKALLNGAPSDHAKLIALITLMAHNQDTNVISRVGLSGLEFVQNASKKVLNTLQEKGFLAFRRDVKQLNHVFIAHRISPSGSADLLSVMLFLINSENIFSEREILC
ncbi:2-(5''-triphosphoribosyl)-3'-dephosphocoenzyme-A synthase [Commensalibacter sp. Nvir]|uniref:triphosphoribosyl-dephospho-CoA synthase CitG n=1 Tax=Commensalibacter sp. Nvir TaxID=3069817 RepID=UPI002D545EFB|nr:2-(5''-triphosphoribosyl)-3'-dephosphocoenzyme-A synthase [Commensalibacter sp. Nvir]